MALSVPCSIIVHSVNWEIGKEEGIKACLQFIENTLSLSSVCQTHEIQISEVLHVYKLLNDLYAGPTHKELQPDCSECAEKNVCLTI